MSHTFNFNNFQEHLHPTLMTLKTKITHSFFSKLAKVFHASKRYYLFIVRYYRLLNFLQLLQIHSKMLHQKYDLLLNTFRKIMCSVSSFFFLVGVLGPSTCSSLGSLLCRLRDFKHQLASHHGQSLTSLLLPGSLVLLFFLCIHLFCQSISCSSFLRKGVCLENSSRTFRTECHFSILLTACPLRLESQLDVIFLQSKEGIPLPPVSFPCC